MFDEKSRLQLLAHERFIGNEQLEFSCRNCAAPTHGARFCDDDCETAYAARTERHSGITPESIPASGNQLSERLDTSR